MLSAKRETDINGVPILTKPKKSGQDDDEDEDEAAEEEQGHDEEEEDAEDSETERHREGTGEGVFMEPEYNWDGCENMASISFRFWEIFRSRHQSIADVLDEI